MNKIKKKQFYNSFNNPNQITKPVEFKNIVDKENFLTHQIYFCDIDVVCPEKINKIKKNNKNERINLNDNKNTLSININDNTLLRNGQHTKLNLPEVTIEREQKEDMRLDYLPFKLQNPDDLNLPFPRGGELTRTKYHRSNEGGEVEGRENLQNKKPEEIIQINY